MVVSLDPMSFEASHEIEDPSSCLERMPSGKTRVLELTFNGSLSLDQRNVTFPGLARVSHFTVTSVPSVMCPVAIACRMSVREKLLQETKSLRCVIDNKLNLKVKLV